MGDRTRLTFDRVVGGFGVGSLGRVFAWIHSGNLDTAIPNGVAVIENAARPAT